MTASQERLHSFHIPVMGTAFTIDSPIKVARYGISSVMSIGDDELCEYTRKYYTEQLNEPFEPIERFSDDYRARRITAYLNLSNRIVNQQIQTLKTLPFSEGSDIVKYFELLPEESPVKKDYLVMKALPEGSEKTALQNQLRTRIRPGSLDVNIMTKIDKNNYDQHGELMPDGFSDALSALRGYAQSDLDSSIIFSAGFNRRLYAYIETFKDFFPDENGHIKKRIILKVSDYRSSYTQGKFLAKKGLWVSEHRIESGLNCGGHVFPSEGMLLGPILDEFKHHKHALVSEFLELAGAVVASKNMLPYSPHQSTRITVQGGIGTYHEDRFLIDYFKVDGTGWATPFLLVPEASNVDDATLDILCKATPDDTYVSEISPLGVRFNTVKGTLSEQQKLARVESGRPGSPCPKTYLISNTEFTKKPICTASTTYQKRKIEQIKGLGLSEDEYKKAYKKVIDKACLCEDLAASALLNHKQSNKRPLMPAICPGPNIAFFSKICTLSEMVGHIYGRINVLNHFPRPNMFVTELKMYIDFLARDIKDALPSPTPKQCAGFKEFKKNVADGIEFYKKMVPHLVLETKVYKDAMLADLARLKEELEHLARDNRQIFSELQPA
jgi:hypothetical protein